jgi:hypothetical protein
MQAPEDIAPDSVTMAGDRRKRTLRLAAATLGVLAVAGGGLVLLFSSMEKKAQARIEAEWSRLSLCMLGAGGLGAGESPSVRFRSIQLTAMVLPGDRRAEPGGVPWPARCATHAHALAEAWKDAGRAGKDAKDLAATSEELAKLLKSVDADPVSADLTGPVDRVWQEAARQKLAAGPIDQAVAPPQSCGALTTDQLKPDQALSKAFFGFKNLFEEANGEAALRVIVEDKSVPDAPFACTLSGEAASCRKLPAPVATLSGLRLLGTTEQGAEPLVFAGNRGSEGVHRSDSGALVERMYSYSGHIAKDGFATLLGWDEAKKLLKLVRQAQGQPAQATALKLEPSISNYFYSTALLWEQLLYRGVNRNNEIHLYARALQRSGEPLGPEQDIGPIPQGGTAEGTPHLTGCRTAQTLAVKAEGYRDEFLTFLSAGRFTPVVAAPGRGGVLTCRNAEATLTQVNRAAAFQVRCTAAGCNETSVKLEELMGKEKEAQPRDGWLQGADLDGKLLVVWAAGERGGLRMRLAPIEQIAKTADVVLYDDLVQDGKVGKMSSLVEMRLLARNEFAVLLLNTSAGVHALRIAPSGERSIIKFDWSR